jgi:hypothetical protein
MNAHEHGDAGHALGAPAARAPHREAETGPRRRAVPARLLERAFDLALFVLGDADDARGAALRACRRLPSAVAARARRSRYVRRSAAHRRGRNRALASDEQLLQQLVYAECEPYERRQEGRGALSETMMVRRFVKHLVRVAAPRSSLYVAIAVARLLRRHRTAEAQEIHAVVTQDPSCVPDDWYFRSRRMVLVDEIVQRFGERLGVRPGPRGERRIEVHEEPGALASVVESSLDRFTPWGTPCVIPPDFDSRTMELAGLADGGECDEGLEMRRIHALIHPACYDRLVEGLGSAAPEGSRVSVPRFQAGAASRMPPQRP